MYSCDLFYNDLKQYMELYNKGLKKNANKLIYESMIKFDGLDDDTKKCIVCDLCKAFCDDDQNLNLSALKLRGNGDMPFELGKRVMSILKSYCDNNVMPHQRWYYQLCNDIEMLEKAYNHEECDDYTVNLYFNSFINDLYWGAHHFPDGCLITNEAYMQIILNCSSIINSHRVASELLSKFDYYKNLYEVWWKYCVNGENFDKGVDLFYKLCDEAGLSFYPITTVYYE